MGDLASAIVDLAGVAENRREGRRSFREAATTVERAVTHLLRVGDEANLERGVGGRPVTYVVEPILWDVTDPLEGGRVVPYHVPTPVLVRYPGVMRVVWDETYEGAVLSDVRRPLPRGGSVRGSAVWRQEPADRDWHYDADLHLATDEDLAFFAAEVDSMLRAFREHLATEARSFRQRAQELTKRVPR